MEIVTLDRAGFDALFATDMQRDFPADEIRPLAGFHRLMERGWYLPLVLMEDGRRVAYAFLVAVPTAGAVLLDYFAVDETLRGRGIGGRALEMIYAHFGAQPVIGEIERIDLAQGEAERVQRQRRLKFYQAHGMRRMNVFSCVLGTPYEIIAHGEIGGSADAARALETVYRALFGEWYEEAVNISTV